LFWKHKGKRYELSLETDVESRALIKADEKIKEIKSRLAQGAPTTNSKVSLDELLTLFLTAQKRRVEAHEFKHRSYEAIDDGVKKIRRECPALLSREAVRVSFKELDDYVHGIRTSQSPTTVNKVVDAFKSAYALANEEHLVAHDPTKKLKRASVHAVKSELIPSDEQYAALLHYFRDSKLSHKWHVIDLVEFLRFFGLRINEARQVLKTDVDLKNRVLTVRKEITKNGKARHIPVFDEAFPLIERLLTRKNLRIYGKEVRTNNLLAIGKCYGALRAAIEKLNLPIKGHHTFRHLAGTKWLECGVNVKQVAEWLGHQDGGALLLKIYAHARKQQAHDEAAKVRWNKVVSPPVEDAVIIDGVRYSKAQLGAIIKCLPQANNLVPFAGAGTGVAEGVVDTAPDARGKNG